MCVELSRLRFGPIVVLILIYFIIEMFIRIAKHVGASASEFSRCILAPPVEDQRAPHVITRLSALQLQIDFSVPQYRAEDDQIVCCYFASFSSQGRG
jgi:hypothetical protein